MLGRAFLWMLAAIPIPKKTASKGEASEKYRTFRALQKYSLSMNIPDKIHL
jgi:hypothetical protein